MPVTVTSVNHRKARLHFDDLNGERAYGPMAFYDRSKLADAVFGHDLHRRLTASGSPVRSLLAHPGYTATNLQTSGPTGLVKLLFGRVLRPLAPAAVDAPTGRRLWEVSEQLTDARFPFPAPA